MRGNHQLNPMHHCTPKLWALMDDGLQAADLLSLQLGLLRLQLMLRFKHIGWWGLEAKGTQSLQHHRVAGLEHS